MRWRPLWLFALLLLSLGAAVPKTVTAGYDAERAKLATQPRYFVRPAHVKTYGDGTDYPFSVDFSTGDVLGSTKTKLPWLLRPQGDVQVVAAELGTSEIGMFKFFLVDVGLEVTKYLSNPALTLNGSHTSGVTTITVNENTVGYPAVGTVEITTSGVLERVRYTGKTTFTFTGCTRGVDGTTAASHNNTDPVANGEEIRPGQRLQLYAGYAPIVESDYMSFVKMEVVRRQLLLDRVTWEIVCKDIQRTQRRQIFLRATQDAPFTFGGTVNPVTAALRVLTSTGAGTNGAYDVLAAENGLAIPQALVDVTALETLRTNEFSAELYEFSIPTPMDGKRFLEEYIWKSLNCYPVVTQDGKLSAKRYELSVGSPTITLGEDEVIAYSPMRADEHIINVIQFNYDFNITGAKGIFGTRRTYEKSGAGLSIAKYGRRTPLVINAVGVRTAQGGSTIADNRALEVIRRFAEPGLILRLDCLYRNHKLEVGDQVKVTLSDVPNHKTGLRGLVDEVFEVIDLKPIFGAEGKVQITLLWVSAIASQTAPTLLATDTETTPFLTEVTNETLDRDLGIDVSQFAWYHKGVFTSSSPRESWREATLEFAYVQVSGDRLEYDQYFDGGNTVGGLDLAAIERGPENAQSATSTTLVLNAAASGTDDVYNDMWLEILSNGTPAANGQTRKVTDYVGSTKTATVATWTTTPTGTISYRVVRLGSIDFGNDQNSISGQPDADVGSRALNQWYHRVIALPSAWNGKTIIGAATAMQGVAASATQTMLIRGAKITTSAAVLQQSIARFGLSEQLLWAYGTESNVTVTRRLERVGAVALGTVNFANTRGELVFDNTGGSVTTTEAVVMTITPFVVTIQDRVRIHAVVIGKISHSSPGKSGAAIATIQARIRKDSVSGTIIDTKTITASGVAGTSTGAAIALLAIDIPLVVSQEVTYVLTLKKVADDGTTTTNWDEGKLEALSLSA